MSERLSAEFVCFSTLRAVRVPVRLGSLSTGAPDAFPRDREIYGAQSGNEPERPTRAGPPPPGRTR
jgi:hypothetical protein